MTTGRPVIGVTRCSRMADYLESVRQAGGEPRELDPAQGSTALTGVDGLLLTGGADVDPELFGEPRHATVAGAEPGRDRFEIDLVRAAIERDVPVLAICRGVQVMNVACGGRLVQDIPTMVVGAIEHQIPEPKVRKAHTIRVVPGSTLARVMGRQPAEELAVNSRHHQAVSSEAVAPGFAVTATAPDGVIEAIERPAARFCVGVQWHPENFCATGEFRSLFDAFVAACRRQLPVC